MHAHRLGAVGFIAGLTLAVAGCGEVDDSVPNQSAAARAIAEKVKLDLEQDRLKRLAPRLAAAIQSAESAPTAAKLSPAPVDTAAVKQARPAAELYAANCASCHGAAGAGDGPLSAGLTPQPAKHADGAYMNALSNEHLFKVVKEGGTAVGKSATMAPWGTSMSDEEIMNLVAHMRGLAQPAYDGPMP